MFCAIFSALTLLACNLETFTALLPAGTATPTRTPRPTFTPRATATQELPPTPEPTATSAASPTPTQRVVATTRPVTKAPPAPPKPQFEWRQNPDNIGSQGLCPAGPGTYEIKGRIRRNNEYVGGVHVVALDSTGKIVAQTDSTPKEYLNPEWGVNCREEKNLFSYQLDVSAGRNNQPIIVRITRSASDLTPISPDIPIRFEADGGRYYLDWISP
jgi:hypothetical protein